MDGTRRPEPAVDELLWPPAPEAAVVDLAIPPEDLPEAQQAFWRRYAPAALEQQTLVCSTLLGFRELCEQFALKQTLAARITSYKLGAASKSADRLLRQYVKLAQRIDASLGRFKLTAFGKPVLPMTTRRPVVSNPWTEVAG